MSGIMNMFVATKTTIATAVDAFFNSVSLLLNTSSTNGAQNNTFLDSSTNNFTITRNGNTTQGTFTPFSQTGWSNYMTTGYLTTASNAGFALSGDFTLECWVFSGDSSLDGSTRRRLFHTGGGDISNSLQLLLGTSGGNSAVISVLNNGFLIDGSINVVTNSWVHIAVTRSGTSLKLFVNGVQSGSTATTSQNFNSGSSNTVYIGANSNGAGIWQGYVSNLRILNGTAAYTSAFTPPTTPFATGTTNQQLLVCASNRFTDINTATSAKTLTVVSTPSVQAFSPFLPTAAYDAAVVGGSGYFDGTGDYLTVADTTSLEPGTGDFCFETWVYHTSASNGSAFDSYVHQPSGGLFVYRNLSNKIQVDSDGVVAILTSASNVPFNSWAHIAVTRSGTTLRIFINGVVDASTTNSTNIAGTGVISYGGRSDGSILDGYLSSTRFVKGSAVYTAAFTPATAPLTAITNTQILLSYTNSGIFDSAAKNDLETVGNAQVSTTQAKWGTTSLSFSATSDTLPMQLSNKNTDFGTGDFTVEFWIYPTSWPSNGTVLYKVSVFSIQRYGANNSMGVTTAAGWLITDATLPSTNTWTHVAVTRSGTSVKVWINGVQSGSTGTSSSSIYFDQLGGQGATFSGYLDDFRVTKGYARYTTTFTPPTAAFPLQ